MAVRDYYAILGVARGDTRKRIREAFHELAWRYHPDRAGPQSALLFQEIVAAYRVLANPRLRAEYDAQPAPASTPPAEVPAAETTQSLPVRVDPFAAKMPGPVRSVSYHHITRPPLKALLQHYRAVLSGKRSGAMQPLDIEVVLTPAEALQGGQVTLQIPVLHPCPTCQGHGANWNARCDACDGRGAMVEERELTLTVPPMRPEETLELAMRGLGLQGLFLRVRTRVREPRVGRA